MSPFELVQEHAVSEEPREWRLAVACALLNKTHGRQVRPMYDRLMAIAPNPGQCLVALRSGALDEVLRPLGLINRRKSLLGAMAQSFLEGLPIGRARGTGEYALASKLIFIDGRTDVETDDPWLRKYLEWRRTDSTGVHYE